MTTLEVRFMYFRNMIVWNACWGDEEDFSLSDLCINDRHIWIDNDYPYKIDISQLTFRKPIYYHLVSNDVIVFNGTIITEGCMS